MALGSLEAAPKFAITGRSLRRHMAEHGRVGGALVPSQPSEPIAAVASYDDGPDVTSTSALRAAIRNAGRDRQRLLSLAEAIETSTDETDRRRLVAVAGVVKSAHLCLRTTLELSLRADAADEELRRREETFDEAEKDRILRELVPIVRAWELGQETKIKAEET